MRLVIRSKSGFTLVELIVTITILAILGTIGFLSLGGYSAGARDATRSTDLANIAKALDTSTIASGTFPTPDNSFNVTFSGGSVWKQGVFADGAATRLNSSALNKAPTDPLTQKAYTYSVLSYGNAYSLKADYEGSAPVAIAPALIEQAHADAGTPNIVYVRGTYQGISAATQASNVYYVLAIPSIISSIGNPGDNIEISANLLSGKLLFSGKDIASPSTFNPNTVVYSGASLPEDDSTGGITTMVSNLKAAYASSDLAGTPNIKNVVSLETAQFAVAGATVINTQLGGKVQMDLIMNSAATSTGNTSTGNTSTGTSLLAIQIVNSANNSACALMSNR
ncbi:MAG: type II secretion system protein [Patescibacteria group bacterium]